MGAKRVLITGTTTGLGRALLEYYVESGAIVVAVNRRRVPDLESRYSSVRFECVDVRNADDVNKLIVRLAEASELPEIFVLNAGINRVDNDEVFQLTSYREVVETNLFGVLNFVEPLTRLPAVGVARHLITIGSMTTLAGNPYALGYFTSKRALTACFEVWSNMYAGTDLVFQRVMLGPVPTAIYTMAERFPRWMVWIRNRLSGTLDGAVRAVSRFALTRRRTLVYPVKAFPLFTAMWIAQRVVPGFFRGRRTLDGKVRRAVTT